MSNGSITTRFEERVNKGLARLGNDGDVQAFLAWLVRAFVGLKDKKSWSEPDLSALWCEKVWFKVVGGQL